MVRREEARTRILDAAQAATVEKGFGGISVPDLLAKTGITERAFFRHFKDEGALAAALLRRSFEEDEWVYDDAFARARDLVDDPLQVFLFGLRFIADRLADMPRRLPGSLLVASCYCERPLGPDMEEVRRTGVLRWRARFRGMFDEIAAIHSPREPVGAEDFADMVSTVLEGGIVLAKALEDPEILPRQVMVLRSYVKLLFVREAPAGGAA